MNKFKLVFVSHTPIKEDNNITFDFTIELWNEEYYWIYNADMKTKIWKNISWELAKWQKLPQIDKKALLKELFDSLK